MIALRVRVAPADAERALVTLLDLMPGGLEERGSDSAVEYVLYGTRATLPTEDTLRRELGAALVSVTESEIADDWQERWKQWHQPVEVAAAGRRVRVRPPWEPPAGVGLGSAGDDRDEASGDGGGGERSFELVIDPGQAFGTGGHHTTRLCLELLLEQAAAGGSLADWGCGTGVLALAGARLGCHPVTAIDFDPAAVHATIDNARVNEIRGIQVQQLDLTAEPGPLADVVVANLILPLLLQVAAGMRAAPPVLIASGLLREQVDEACTAFARVGLRETARRASGEWAAVVLESE